MKQHYKFSDIGNIPADWDFGRIDDFFEIQQGKQVSKSNRIGANQKPFLRTSNLMWGKVVLDELDYLNFSKDEELKYALQPNDLLVCEGGDIGRTAIWRGELDGCYYQNHLHRLRAKNGTIRPDFILFWMQYAMVFAKLYFGRGNVTTIPNLSKSRLAEFTIPVPPLREQRHIAYILSTVQKAIEQQDKLICATTELKKALMKKLFTEGTKGEKQKMTEIGPVPESWEVVELGKYAFIENGFAFKSQDYVKEGIPLIRISNVSHGFFIHNDNKYLPEGYIKTYSKFALKDGDLIISLTRPVTSGGLKYCFVEQKDLPALLNQRVGRFQIKDTNKLIKNYLFHLVFSNYFVGELFKLFGNSSQQPNVSPSQLESFKVPIPKIDEQVIISNTLSLLFNKTRKAEEKKRALSDLFKTLLNELMTGARRVHEIEFDKMPEAANA